MKDSTNEVIGKRFIGILIGILVFSVLVYAVCHLLVKDQIPGQGAGTVESPCGNIPFGDSLSEVSWQNFAWVEPNGHVKLKNIAEIDWYVGAERAKEVLNEVRNRAEKMDGVNLRVQENLNEKAHGLLNPKTIHEIKEFLIQGKYQKAYLHLDELPREMANADINGLKQDLLLLDQQMTAQCRDIVRLAPPLNSMFFWTSPTLSIFEVLFWAFFGVLANLLVSSAEYLRKGDFQPIETWVAYPKLIYGPILAVVLVLALINGFFTVENYKLRVWTLPLVGFIFGYAARRTARLVEKVIERFLGKAEQGIAKGPEAASAKQTALVNDLKNALKPRNMEDLRSQAKKLAKEITENEVKKGEGK